MAESPTDQVEDGDAETQEPYPAGFANRDRLKTVDSLVDSWGSDSFPASDPPGCLPPTLEEQGWRVVEIDRVLPSAEID